MRTPNTECIICKKELYRRPFELKKTTFSCCVSCRGQAYKLYPNQKSIDNLELGREKGTNHLTGIAKSEKHKNKIKNIMTEYCKNNPEKVKERGKKIRAENHYKWKNNATNLNQSIRRLNEMRIWQKRIKERDKVCKLCGSVNELESHHIVPLIQIIYENNITNSKQARSCEPLWNLENGFAVCKKCHCKIHNIKYTKTGEGRRRK